MNRELAYKIQMLPANVRCSRTLTVTALLRSGWPVAMLERDIDDAMSWASSHLLTVQQDKIRKARARREEKIKNDDAFDMMFASGGGDPATIPRR